jgi:UDP:flavonoid glycosyltransferase YjiC (YdhE family)
MLNKNLVRASSEALMGLIEDRQADAVVDFCNPFACIAAKALRKPLITIIQADMHPASRGFIWWKPPPAHLPTPAPVLNSVLAAYDLCPISKTEALLLGDLTLVVGMPETDPLPETADVIYVGPILWQKPGAKLPGWADDLSEDKPVIWVYSGNPRYVSAVRSPVDSAVVIEACSAALADEDVQVVLTTGHHALPKGVLALPHNFYYEPFVPGLAMAARSQLLIHHGGYGSCQTGLYTGTPAVIIPTYSERESNARRIAAVGAGEFVLPVTKRWGKKRVSVQALQAKIRAVLSDPAYRDNARLMRDKLLTYGGATEAARLIEGFVRKQRTGGTVSA